MTSKGFLFFCNGIVLKEISEVFLNGRTVATSYTFFPLALDGSGWASIFNFFFFFNPEEIVRKPGHRSRRYNQLADDGP